MKGKRRNINRLTVSRSLEGSYRSFYEKCENPRHITVHTSDTNNGDIIQINLVLDIIFISFQEVIVIAYLLSEKDKADEDSSSTAGIRHYVVAASLCRASARPLPSSA